MPFFYYFSDQDTLCSETLFRQATFSNVGQEHRFLWNNRANFAICGLLYTGSADVVECYYCKVQIYDWQEKDIPALEHYYLSPKCDFIQNFVRKRLKPNKTSFTPKGVQTVNYYKDTLPTLCRFCLKQDKNIIINNSLLCCDQCFEILKDNISDNVDIFGYVKVYL